MFRVRWRLAAGLTLATVAIAVPVILVQPKQYTASTSLGVETKSPDALTTLLMPTNLASQEEIIRSERVTRQVIETLGFGADPQLRESWRQASAGRGRFEDWLAEQMQRRLTVTPSRRGDNVITIQYRSFSPAEAAAVANAFARHYAEAAIEMKVEPARQYARWFGEQNKKLRAELEAAQSRLSAFQRDKGIGIRDENLGAETERLASLAAQLTAVQSAAVDQRSKLRTGGDALPEVMQNPVIQGLRGDILRLEGKLRDAGANFGANHPQYRAMQAELAELKARLADETRHVVSSVSAAR
jgi:succinoglycan biosynthesis transport protein ExoP